MRGECLLYIHKPKLSNFFAVHGGLVGRWGIREGFPLLHQIRMLVQRLSQIHKHQHSRCVCEEM